MNKKKVRQLTRRLPDDLEKDGQCVIIREQRRSGIILHHAFQYEGSPYWGWGWCGSRIDLEDVIGLVKWAFPCRKIDEAPVIVVKT